MQETLLRWLPGLGSVFGLTPRGAASAPRFRALRRRIDHAPAGADATLDSLPRFLGGVRNDDLGRVYALFYWIATQIRYDVRGFLSGDLGDLAPESVLRRREAVCSGYSQLFHALATRMGLELVEVTGVAKGYGYSERGELGPHAWNAVRFGGRWHLIDSTWGAGHLDEQMRFVQAIEHGYFAPPPAHLIYSHFPEDSAWQLLAKPLSMDAFTRLPELKPSFFDLGLAWVTPVDWIHLATDRSILVLEARRNLEVMVTLKRGQQILPDRFTLIERRRRRLCIHVLFPEPGIYSLCIFAKAGQQAGALWQVAGLKLDADRGQGWDAGFGPGRGIPLFGGRGLWESLGR